MRLAAVIDFTQWRGQRSALADYAVTPRRDGACAGAAKAGAGQLPMAMGLASAAAVAGAVVVRMHADSTEQTAQQAAPFEEVAITDPASGVGGPLRAIDYPDDEMLVLRHYPELAPLVADPAEPLAPVAEYREVELRDPRCWSGSTRSIRCGARTASLNNNQPPRRTRSQCSTAHAWASCLNLWSASVGDIQQSL